MHKQTKKTPTAKKSKTIVVALGGNAITKAGEKGTIPEQFVNTRESMKVVISLIQAGYRVLITHGNGPQVGNELIRVERSSKIVPNIPLGVLVGDTEGGMGYMIQQCLYNVLLNKNITSNIACIITQTVVDPNDPSIENPSKFVGQFYKEHQVDALVKKRGWVMKADSDRGWRRVVPSPIPYDIIEKETVRKLLDSDTVVIAAGGGGIPVYRTETGWLEGLDAVVDKDLASAVLGNSVEAEELMILTGVDQVAINFGKPNQKFIAKMTTTKARKLLKEGHFPPGSMGPKIAAAVNFIDGGGKQVIITSVEKAVDAQQGNAGTVITGG